MLIGTVAKPGDEIHLTDDAKQWLTLFNPKP